MIGAAVAGLGVGEAHARAYATDERVELRSVFDLDLVRARSVAATLGTRAGDPH